MSEFIAVDDPFTPMDNSATITTTFREEPRPLEQTTEETAIRIPLKASSSST